MSAARHLRIVDLDSGEILEADVGLEALTARVTQLEENLADAERDLRAKRRRIAELERDKQAERDNYERRDELVEIVNEWRRVCNKPRAKLTDDRFDAVRALLDVTKPKPYTREHFSLAFAGAAFDPYIVRRKNGSEKRFDDLALICRGGAQLEEFIRKAPKS